MSERSAAPPEARYYYRARYYDPKIGRFISEDPLGFKAEVNFYRYAMDSPANWTDPMGWRALPTDSLPPSLKRCFCTLWKRANRGNTPREQGAAIFYNPNTDDFYCVFLKADPRDNRLRMAIPEGAVGHAHTHPNNRTQGPSDPQDYTACQNYGGYVLTRKGITYIPKGCKQPKCTTTPAGPDWTDDCE